MMHHKAYLEELNEKDGPNRVRTILVSYQRLAEEYKI
jgi:hypothetical protein